MYTSYIERRQLVLATTFQKRYSGKVNDYGWIIIHGKCVTHHPMMEAVNSLEMLVNIYQTT
jgi:hypothetical protein